MQHLQNTKPQETSESGEVIVLPPLQVRRRAPAFTRRMNDFLQRVIPALLGLGLLVVLWQLAAINSKGFPTPLSTLDSAMTLFADPFYRDGPNDMGIGWNVLASLQRVAIGFGLAALAGIPLDRHFLSYYDILSLRYLLLFLYQIQGYIFPLLRSYTIRLYFHQHLLHIMYL